MKLKRLLAMLLTLCMVLTLLPGVAMAKGVGATIYVAANGSDDNPGTEESPYANIQKAVNVANDGDTIIVKEGSYNVWCPTSDPNNYTGRNHNLFIGKNITIVGEGDVNIYSYQTIYQSTFDARIIVLISGSDGVVLDNLNLYPAYYPEAIDTELPTVNDSTVNSITDEDGLKVYYNQIVDTLMSYNNGKATSETTIKNVTVRNCTIGDPDLAVEEWGSAIYFNGYNNNSKVGISGGYTIENNILYGCISLCEDAGCDATSETCIIRNNTFYDNLMLSGERPSGWNFNSMSVFPTVTGNTFNTATWSLTDTDGITYDYCIGSRDKNADKIFTQEQLQDILDNNTFAGDLDDKGIGISIGAHTYSTPGDEHHAIIYAYTPVAQIGNSGETQTFGSLSEAIDEAKNGDTITLLVDLSDQTVSLTKPNVGYTLDLNQKTLEMKPTGYLLNVPNEKTITIKNGTMNVDGTNLPQYSSSCEYLIGLTNASSALNLDNVDFTVTNVSKPDDSQRDWYVFNLDAGSVNLTNGTKLSFSDLAKAFYAPAIQTAEINVKDSEISFEGILNMCFHCDRVMLDNGKITVTDSENAGVFVHSGLTATNNSVVTIDNVYRTFSGSDMAHGECLVMDATSSITETNTEAVSITGDVTVPSGADISLDSDLEIYGTAAIADGRYKGTIAKGADAASISITGGTFSVDPSEYVASGYVVNMVSGKYVVSKQPPTSGGGSTPPTVTVPVSSDSGSANVSASISGTAVTVSITDQDLSQVIASAGNTGNVVIDVSGLNNVTSAVIPSKVITAVNGAEDATGLTVALPGGSVGLDSDALAAVAAAAGGADVTMSVETVDTSKLSESQQAVLGNQISNAIVVDVSIMAQGTAISSFDGGTVTISVPYEPEEGTDTSKLVVWYLADDGTISPVEGAYDPATKSFVFKTSHLSTYALVSFPFEDVTAGSWYYGNVAYVFNNNLFNGTSSSTFSPDDTMTRAMLMTVLARMAGQDTAVEDGVWYEKGMNWAVENGISDGTNPEGSITREQLVTMLYRYAGSPEASGDLSAFSDADKVDGYATLAMQWAVGKGLINGMGDGTLAPRDTATRAQVAAILMRFCENIIA